MKITDFIVQWKLTKEEEQGCTTIFFGRLKNERLWIQACFSLKIEMLEIEDFCGGETLVMGSEIKKSSQNDEERSRFI